MDPLRNRHLYTGIVETAKLPIIHSIVHQQSQEIGIVLTSFPKDINNYIEQLNALVAQGDSDSGTSFLAFPESPPKGIDSSAKQARNALRLSTLLHLKESNDEKICIVTTPEALFGNVPSLDTFVDNTCILKVGDRYDYRDLVKQLTEHLNYDVEAACENAGEIAIRGGIIDCLLYTSPSPRD